MDLVLWCTAIVIENLPIRKFFGRVHFFFFCKGFIGFGSATGHLLLFFLLFSWTQLSGFN